MLRYYTFNVIDKSGSMMDDCSRDMPGYRRMDFAKHGCKLCVQACPENMQKAIITYDSDATLISPLTKMTPAAKAALCQKIDQIQPSGGTNILSALKMVRNMVDDLLRGLPDDETRMKQLDRISVIAFTDGDDRYLNLTNMNYELLGNLTIRVGKQQVMPFRMQFIGFGSDINTPLATKMVALFLPGSHFLYMNDSSVVGTIFGRAMARIYMGNECYGLNTKLPVDQEAAFHNVRLQFVDVLRLPREKARPALHDLITQVRASQAPVRNLLCGFADLLEKQALLALNNDDYYCTWGIPYIAMMANCLEQQFSPSFKETALECFGSARAQKEYDAIKRIYEQMPVLNPSGNTRGYQVMDAAMFAATCSNPDAQCWHPQSRLTLSTGETVSFEQLEQRLWKEGPQHVLAGENQTYVSVFRLVRMLVWGPTNFHPISKDCWITDGHPIMERGQWVHPKGYDIIQDNPGYVYNIVLDPMSPHKDSIWVDGVRCLAWGHGIQDDEIATHDYFGEKIVEMLGRRGGPMVVLEGRFLRDPATDWICGYEESDPTWYV